MPSTSSSAENERSPGGRKQVLSVDPFRCRMWAHHERLEDHITEETCRAEVDSHHKYGQLIPVLGRPLKNDPWHEVELIYGARRLFVAKHLNTPLLVELRELTDKEAVVAMELENHHRQAPSPYERGLCFSKWLQSGLFESLEDIARAVNISKSQVSRYLKMARLPSVVVAAFGSPTEICETWGLDLMSVWEDPERQRALARRARAINAGPERPAPREVYRSLMCSATQPAKKAAALVRDEVVRGCNGDPLFRIRHQHRSVAVVLPTDRISKGSLQKIRAFIAGLLQDATEQALENSEESAHTWLPEEAVAPPQMASGGTANG
jgi:ParB family transcriptional regulator, chromosome partitioning protein